MKVRELIGLEPPPLFSPEEATRRIRKLEEIVELLSQRLSALDSQELFIVPTTTGLEIKSVPARK